MINCIEHLCSSITEYIKLVAKQASHFNLFNEINNTWALPVRSIDCVFTLTNVSIMFFIDYLLNYYAPEYFR